MLPSFQQLVEIVLALQLLAVRSPLLIHLTKACWLADCIGFFVVVRTFSLGLRDGLRDGLRCFDGKVVTHTLLLLFYTIERWQRVDQKVQEFGKVH